MTKFFDTPAAAEFIATADSRETSEEVMRAIAWHARSLDEAEAIWRDGYTADMGAEALALAIWETATDNGAHGVNLNWGAAGEEWVPAV